MCMGIQVCVLACAIYVQRICIHIYIYVFVPINIHMYICNSTFMDMCTYVYISVSNEPGMSCLAPDLSANIYTCIIHIYMHE